MNKTECHDIIDLVDKDLDVSDSEDETDNNSVSNYSCCEWVVEKMNAQINNPESQKIRPCMSHRFQHHGKKNLRM